MATKIDFPAPATPIAEGKTEPMGREWRQYFWGWFKRLSGEVASLFIPSGTGFRHVTGGVEDLAAKLVENADVKSGAAIAESKLALAYGTSALNSAIISHTGNTSNPHSTTAAQVGADPAGAASSAVSAHAGLSSSVHGFDASGNAPAQSHDNTRHSTAYAADSLAAHLAGAETITGAKTFSRQLDVDVGLTDAIPAKFEGEHAAGTVVVINGRDATANVGVALQRDGVNKAQFVIDGAGKPHIQDGNGADIFMLPNAPIIGATKTKITYDAKGLVTSGADATYSDVGAEAAGATSTHAGLTTGVHGVGASAIASTLYVDNAFNALSGRLGAGVADIAALRALNGADQTDKEMRLVEAAERYYRYDTAGTGADDGVITIVPQDITPPAPGRWFVGQAATQTHNALIGLQGGTTNEYNHLTNAQVSALHSNASDHARQHAITDASDHTSTITPGKLFKAAATTGLPAEATNTDAEVAAAVTASHSNASDHTRVHDMVTAADHQATAVGDKDKYVHSNASTGAIEWVSGVSAAAHQLDGALHTVSGLTTGHFLKATSATAFGFAAHGLSYSDVGAAASGAVTGSSLTMATSRLLGRTTATAGAIEEISVSTGLSLTGGVLSCSVVGGMTNPMTLLGDTISGGASGTPAATAGNTTSTPKYYRSLGSGGVATAPTWQQPAIADLSDATTVGQNLVKLANPGAVAYPKIAADNTVSTRTAAQLLGDLGATTVGGNLFALANPGAITWPRLNADNTVTALSAANTLTALGASTVGGNFFGLTNPGAITFPRINADNTVTALSAANFAAAIGAASASGLATLNASSLVVQNPASASTTGGASKILLTDANGVGVLAQAGANALQWTEVLQNSNNSNNTGYGVGIKFKNSDYTTSNETNKWAGIAVVGANVYSCTTDLAFYAGNETVGVSTDAPTEKMRLKGTYTGALNVGNALGCYLSGNSYSNWAMVGQNLIADGSAGNALKTPSTSAWVGYRGILFSDNNGMEFFTESAATTAGATVTPTAKMTLSNTGVLSLLGRWGITDTGGTPDHNYSGAIYITRAASNTAQYVNFIRQGTQAWSLGLAYNTSTFCIGIGRAESDFTVANSALAITPAGAVSIASLTGSRVMVTTAGNDVASASGNLSTTGGANTIPQASADGVISISGNHVGYIANFSNSGDNANRCGISVQGGTNNGSGTDYLLAACDGGGNPTGYLETVSGVFQLADVSDARLKQDIAPSKVKGLDVINAIDLIEYRYKKQGNNGHLHPIGFTAQNLETVYPDAVSLAPDGDTKAVARTALIPVMVKAIQQVSARGDLIIAEAKARADADEVIIADHTATLKDLAKRIEALEKKAIK